MKAIEFVPKGRISSKKILGSKKIQNSKNSMILKTLKVKGLSILLNQTFKMANQTNKEQFSLILSSIKRSKIKVMESMEIMRIMEIMIAMEALEKIILK